MSYSIKTLTLHECVEGARGWQVGGDSDILFVGALRLNADWAVGISAVAAHSARGVSDISQTPVTVIPTKKYTDVKQRRQTGACHLRLCINSKWSRIINSAVAWKMYRALVTLLNHKAAVRDDDHVCMYCRCIHGINELYLSFNWDYELLSRINCCHDKLAGRNVDFFFLENPHFPLVVTNCCCKHSSTVQAVKTAAKPSVLSTWANKTPNDHL